VLFYGVIAFWGDSVFALIFGSPYEGTGIWAGALALRCGAQFLSSPVSTGFYAMQQPRPPVYSGLFSLVITLIALLFMVSHGLPLHQILWIHSILMVFNILLYNIFMLSAVQKLQR
jgi:O-antigen/teichoic acid export membrane protein